MHGKMATRKLAARPSLPAASLVSKPQPVLVHSDSEWAAIYPEIEQLYVHERRKLRYVMQCMESENGFKATEQMYKKRFAKWGFKKNTKRPDNTRRPLKKKTKWKGAPSKKTNPPGELESIDACPGLGHRDGMTLMFLTSVHTWSMAYFESWQCCDKFLAPQQRLPEVQLRPPNFKEAGFAFKLVVNLLDRGHGHLAGRMARKAFLLIEDMLVLEGPALVWNLLEIMHYMVKLRQAQLFSMLLAHLIALADGQLAETHPLPVMLRALRGLVEMRTTFELSVLPSTLPSLLERAWTVNAEILFDNSDPGLFHLYCRILWDSCSLSLPVAIVFRQLEVQQAPSAGTVVQRAEPLLASPSVREDRMMQHLLTPRTDASPPQDYKLLRASSIAALRERGNSIRIKEASFNGETAMLIPMLAGLATAKILETLPAVDFSRLHAGNMACAIKTLVELDVKHDGNNFIALLDAIERRRAIFALREYAECETHPQVVLEMWLLQDALVAAGKLGDAEEVERDAYRRVEKFIQDIRY